MEIKNKEWLKYFATQMEAEEMSQIYNLVQSCNNPFQFAKTHSMYVNDWKKQKEMMENNLLKGIFPPGVDADLFQQIINISDNIVQKKLKIIQFTFQNKFKESIFNYLKSDGTTRKLFGIF